MEQQALHPLVDLSQLKSPLNDEEDTKAFVHSREKAKVCSWEDGFHFSSNFPRDDVKKAMV